MGAADDTGRFRGLGLTREYGLGPRVKDRQNPLP